MCGIAGIVNSKLSHDDLEKHLASMQRALRHRGPDDQGLFISQRGNAGLVSTRLAILDLSPAGHQPMTSRDRRYTIAFNGEIYNFRALRDQIINNGQPITSNSDTEVVLELFQREGPQCLEKLEGMFAFAIWDEQEQSLFLARDPLGIKPVYYQTKNGSFCFASELRALLSSGLVPREISTEGIDGYLMYGSVPEPSTLVMDVKMLPAGHYLVWQEGRTELTKYWDVEFGERSISGCRVRCPQRKPGESPLETANATTKKAGEMTYPEAVKTVRAALEESIERHLVSDVPVGVFLSGGIDSTTLVALASQKTKEPLRTFSISFDDPDLDEGNVAARTATHFGTQHSDWRLDSATAKELLGEFLERSDQPSIDGFNTFCVSKMAHDHGLKVVLSGLGGDEIFGGYPSFATVPKMLSASRLLNAVAPLRSAAGRLLESVGSAKMRRLASFMQSAPSSESAYWCMRGIFTPREVERFLPRYVSGNGKLPSLNPSGRGRSPLRPQPSTLNSLLKQPTPEDEVSYLELTRYMRNQLLRDSDVMSMAWSLELRVPFADRKLIDTVSQIPARWRLATGKQILLDAVPEIPDWVRNRPKQGFTFPFKDWVTTEWQDVFHRIEKESPVPLKNWYRTWCIFALENFLKKLGAGSKEQGPDS